MRIFKVIFNEDDLTEGIQAISLVNSPAIESNWVTLSKEAKAQPLKLKTVNEERRIVLGAVLIPDKPILRMDADGEFFIYFTDDTIRKSLEFYAMRGTHSKATVEHEFKTEQTTVTEMWIKEDAEKDKSLFYGIDEPVGTWFAMMKVHDENIWNDYIKTGALNGFSIEGFFSRELQENLKAITPPKNETFEKVVNILTQVS